MSEPSIAPDACLRVTDSAGLAQETAEIWASVLNLPQVGVNDEFYTLGGDSLDAATIELRIEERFGVDLPRNTVLDHATPARLVALMLLAKDAA